MFFAMFDLATVPVWLICFTYDLPSSLVLSPATQEPLPLRLFRLPRGFPARGVRPRGLSRPS